MLTKRQKQTFDFISSFKNKKGIAPSLEEIKKHLKISSVSTAHHHVKKLQEAGYLQKEYNQPRAMATIDNRATIKVPIIGVIAAGQPIEAIETQNETITISRDEVGKYGKNYALRVQGNSMVDEGIFDGDIVVIRHQQTADNGQTVVAIIDNNEATLKKI